jgi:cytochrome c553
VLLAPFRGYSSTLAAIIFLRIGARSTNLEKRTQLQRFFKFSLVVLLLGAFAGARAADDLRTQSRTPFLHNIPLHDEDGKVISVPAEIGDDGKPQEPKGPPYSTAQTCGKCHDYGLISRGWHFNESLGNQKPGRPGEAWILTDPATHTQIPLSYRGWKGTFKPADIGLSDYDFLTNFSRHFPGGGMGEPDTIDAKDPKMGRMQITGKLEIDCLICHQSTGNFNHEARYTALKGEDFAWAPSISAGLGTYGSFRSAAQIAKSWHPGKTITSTPPPIKYDRSRFDADNNVTFQVTRRSPVGNCYYCHSTQTRLEDARWHSDGDVHIRAGMLCVDCHRNGLDHMTVRGYEGESKDRAVSDADVEIRAKLLQRDDTTVTDDAARKLARAQLESEISDVDTLTCAGCHASGRFGSPRPFHVGLPPVHFQKLTCTACHSGPFPGPQPDLVLTSIAHKLGLPSVARGKETAPVIVEPVFLYDSNGKIAPFKMVWPSYWARLMNGKLVPLLPSAVASVIDLPKQKPEDVERDPYNTKPLSTDDIHDALEAMREDSTNGQPVFIAAGKMYKLEKDKLVSEENAAAAPYSWALAHDVRPARQALGAKGCADCHSGNSPAFFGTAIAQGPVNPTNAVRKEMWELRGEDPTWIKAFALGFEVRPFFKGFIVVMGLIVLSVLIHFTLRGVGAIASSVHRNKSGQ